jgi:hypothetical protein
VALSPESASACAAFRTLHPKLYDLALAIQQHEGWFPKHGPKAESRSWRNNNPGNLRKSGLAIRVESGFAVFEDYYTGLLALLLDLAYKCLDHSAHNLGPNSTLEDLIRVWAPPHENDTERYVQVACARTGMTDDTTLSEVYWS